MCWWDVVSPDAERITYEYVTPEDVATILEHLHGEPVKKLLAGEDWSAIFCQSNPHCACQLR